MRYITETINLTGPCGHLGSIRAIDLWQFRESVAQAIEGVATIASLSYGNDAAKNPDALFKSIVDRGHLSCLEFVPWPELAERGKPTLPCDSMRHSSVSDCDDLNCVDYLFDGDRWAKEDDLATGFLVEAPIFVARQWMRHRAFSYLEMSRRYVKDAKVPFTFYGQETASVAEHQFYENALALYGQLLAKNEPPERARRVIPVGAMTKFWVGGYNHDWKSSFIKLRAEKHAQEEIRIFGEWIEKQIG